MLVKGATCVKVKRCLIFIFATIDHRNSGFLSASNIRVCDMLRQRFTLGVGGCITTAMSRKQCHVWLVNIMLHEIRSLYAVWYYLATCKECSKQMRPNMMLYFAAHLRWVHRSIAVAHTYFYHSSYSIIYHMICIYPISINYILSPQVNRHVVMYNCFCNTNNFKSRDIYICNQVLKQTSSS